MAASNACSDGIAGPSLARPSLVYVARAFISGLRILASAIPGGATISICRHARPVVPGLIPLLYTFGMYRLLYKKNQSPVVLVAGTLLLGIAFAYIGTAL